MDCYKVLRLHPNASSDDIEKAANKMKAIWNPSDYDEEYREVALCVVDDVKKAKRILMDPIQRRKHDKELNYDKLANQSCHPRVKISSDAGLPGSYAKPWVKYLKITDQHETKAAISSNGKVAKFLDESFAFSEINAGVIPGRYLTSTPKDDERHEIEEYSKNFDVKWDLISSTIDKSHHSNINESEGYTEFKEAFLPHKSEDLNAKINYLNDTFNLSESESSHNFQNFLFVGTLNPMVNRNEHFRLVFNQTKVTPVFSATFGNSMMARLNKREDCSTENENNLQILHNSISKNDSKMAQQSDQLKNKVFEVKYSLYTTKNCCHHSLENLFGNVKISNPELNSDKSIFVFTKYASIIPDLSFEDDINNSIKDDLLHEYLEDTLECKHNSSHGSTTENTDAKSESCVEPFKNYSECTSAIREETCTSKDNHKYLLNNELTENNGLIDILSVCRGIQNNPLSDLNEDSYHNEKREEFLDDAMNMIVTVSIQCMDHISDFDKKTNKHQENNSNDCKSTSNEVCYENLFNKLVSLNIKDVEVETSRLPDGQVLKFESSLKSTLSDNDKETQTLSGVAKSSYFEEGHTKIISVVAILGGKEVITKYYFNDKEEKVEVYVGRILKCSPRND